MTSVPDELRRFAATQYDVVTTQQAGAYGASADRVERLARHGYWRRIHRGVYVVHTGPLTWPTRAQGALLRVGPGAVLSHAAAAYEQELRPAPPRVIDVSVPHGRQPAVGDGVRVHRRRDLRWSTRRFAMTASVYTVVDIAQQARSADEVLAVLGTAARAGVLPAALVEEIARRPRVRRRRLLLDLLGDVDAGAESALEARYLRDVERAHRLPPGERQRWERTADGWIRGDVRYRGHRVRVELDGRLGHPGGRTDKDTWRDNLVVLAHDEVTLRFRWAHVASTPCATAAQVLVALRSRGWQGTPRRCSPQCPVR